MEPIDIDSLIVALNKMTICKNCKYYDEGICYRLYYGENIVEYVSDDDCCSKGEPKINNEQIH